MNVKLLRKIQKHILAEPRRLDMQYIYTPRQARKAEPPCGTVCCIAGWAIYLKHKGKVVPYDGIFLKSIKDETVMGAPAAEKILSINKTQKDNLFFMWGWPEKFRKLYDKAKTAKTRAKIASERIDLFIATKGAE